LFEVGPYQTVEENRNSFGRRMRPCARIPNVGETRSKTFGTFLDTILLAALVANGVNTQEFGGAAGRKIGGVSYLG
jgi:hypothetical protein